MKKRLMVTLCAVVMSAAAMDTASAQSSSPVPTSPGQAAFGTISEVVRILQADPATDWSKVNIEALRQHLIDMDAVIMHSTIVQKNVPGGFEAVVTGTGSVSGSIQRLASNHAGMLNTMSGLQATAVPVANGVRVVIIASNPGDAKAVARLRGLGFAGMLTEGSHHQPHHLAMARGEMVHKH